VNEMQVGSGATKGRPNGATVIDTSSVYKAVSDPTGT
jgi:hypothetical protein